MDTNSEEWRRICEARAWLRRGYTSRAAVDALVRQVARQRGAEAAARLREDMREEYRAAAAKLNQTSELTGEKNAGFP